MGFTKLIKIDLLRRPSVSSRGQRSTYGTEIDTTINDKASALCSDFEIGPSGISSDYSIFGPPSADESSSKGVIYNIATWHGKRPYANPHLCGLVKVFISSTLQGNVKEILDRMAVMDNNIDGLTEGGTSIASTTVVASVCTRDVEDSWITLDFGKGRHLLPTRYRLKYGGGHSTLGSCAPRNWQLRGRVDEKTSWKVLYDHVEDDSLAEDVGAVASWNISCPKATLWDKVVGRKTWDQTLGFRFFQIIQTGPNSSGNDVLSLGGIEFFGRLTETEEVYFASYFQHDLPPFSLNREGLTRTGGTGWRSEYDMPSALVRARSGRTRSQSALLPLNRRRSKRKSSASQASGSTDSLQGDGSGLCCVPFCCVKPY
jgi:hypothetical protein